MLDSAHFKTELELLSWANDIISEIVIISVVKDASNGDWVLFFNEV